MVACLVGTPDDPDNHQDDCECFGCKVRYWRETGGLQIHPNATPNRRNKIPPRDKSNSNAWERGIPTDSRGMPLIKPGTLSPVTQKEYAEHRHAIEEGRRALHQTPPSAAPPQAR